MEDNVRFISPLERALYLKTVGSLNELSHSELAAIAQTTKERYYKKGSAVYNPGQRLESFQIIVEGQLRVNSDEHGATTLGPSEVVGFLTLVAESPQGLEAVAETDTTTLEVRSDELFDVMEDNFDFIYFAIRNMARRMLLERREIPQDTYLAPAEGLLECPDRELDLIERLLFLRRGTALQKASMDSLIEIAQEMEEVHYEADDVIWKPGDTGGAIQLIVDGSVTCTIEASGRHFRVGPGYPMGNLENLAGEPRWYTAVAENRVVALVGHSDRFLDMLEDHFDMARGFLAAMATGVINLQTDRRNTEAGAVLAS